MRFSVSAKIPQVYFKTRTRLQSSPSLTKKSPFHPEKRRSLSSLFLSQISTASSLSFDSIEIKLDVSFCPAVVSRLLEYERRVHATLSRGYGTILRAIKRSPGKGGCQWKGYYNERVPLSHRSDVASPLEKSLTRAQRRSNLGWIAVTFKQRYRRAIHRRIDFLDGRIEVRLEVRFIFHHLDPHLNSPTKD